MKAIKCKGCGKSFDYTWNHETEVLCSMCVQVRSSKRVIRPTIPKAVHLSAELCRLLALLKHKQKTEYKQTLYSASQQKIASVKGATHVRHSIEDYMDYDFDNFSGNRIWCLMRDNFKCTVCGTRGKLTVHHKDGIGFAYPQENRNNHLSNLQTVCNKCHKDIEPETPLRIEDLVDRKKCRAAVHVAETCL